MVVVGRRVALLVVAVLVCAACGQAQTSTTTSVAAAATTVSTPPAETSTTTAVDAPAPAVEAPTETVSATGGPGGQEDGSLLALVDGLVVEGEQPDGYDRGLFRHWVDADGDGCDTRREVLITEAVTAPSVSGDCALAGGVWVSRYDGVTESGSGRGFDVDHLVPLKEAWDSGAHS